MKNSKQLLVTLVGLLYASVTWAAQDSSLLQKLDALMQFVERSEQQDDEKKERAAVKYDFLISELLKRLAKLQNSI